MNEKHAREARIVNRVVGGLGKRGSGKPHKLPRAVKANFEGKSHRERGALSATWRGLVAKKLEAAGIELNGARKIRLKEGRDVIDLRQWFRQQPRGKRNNIRRVFNYNTYTSPDIPRHIDINV